MGNITIHSIIKFKDYCGSVGHGIVVYIDFDYTYLVISADFQYRWANNFSSKRLKFEDSPEEIKDMYNSLKKYMFFYDDECKIHRSVLRDLNGKDIVDLLKNRKTLSDLLCGTEVYK